MKKIYFTMLILCISMGIFTRNSYGKETVHHTGTRIEAVSAYADSEPEENFTFEERREGRYITGYIGTNKNIVFDRSAMKDVAGIAEGAFERSAALVTADAVSALDDGSFQIAGAVFAVYNKNFAL